MSDMPKSESLDMMPSSYPDLASPTDSVIAGDFGSLSSVDQERQRDDWKSELVRTEEEIETLRQVLASKEAHATRLKRRLGITAWREFSGDMQNGLKNLQETSAYRRTAEGLTAVKSRTASAWSSISSSHSFIHVSGKVGSAFGAARSRMSASLSSQNLQQPSNTTDDRSSVQNEHEQVISEEN